MLHCYTATFGIFNEKVMEMNKEMYLTEHLVLPSEATLSQTSELDGVRKLSIHSFPSQVPKVRFEGHTFLACCYTEH